MPDTTVVRHRNEGEAISMLGGAYEVKAAGSETNDRITVMEMIIPEGAGPPPHTHPGGEAVYVLEGTLRYHIDGETVEGGPGSFFYVAAGAVENFEPVTQVRLLVIYAPGGIDDFFREAGEPGQAGVLPPPPDGPPDVERLAAIASKYGMDIQAPAEA
jgi:quercetin dioxygenase-like cupin family protein